MQGIKFVLPYTILMNTSPTISFIIPCYELGHFLKNAIDSCLSVTVSKEIIVVNDGSSDNTAQIARSYPDVRCYEQQNQGLPSARNVGLALASGEYICFLDADDWIIPENILISLNMLKDDPASGMVFGRHLIQNENGSVQAHQPTINQSIYHHLLCSNIIGNPSTVVYKTGIAKQFPFSANPAYKGCEDYQQYLRIALQHKIIHHDHPVSVYRRHPENMSKNVAMMLCSALNVLNDHRKYLSDPEEIKQWETGVKAWLQYYSYFPLRSEGKLQINRYHWILAKKMGWKLPCILLQKLMRPVNII